MSEVTCPRCGFDLDTTSPDHGPWYDPACPECRGVTYVLTDRGDSVPCSRCRPLEPVPAPPPVSSQDRRELEESP